ncbi:hypothetical protein CAPTEDRAFT_162669 [Capitella teleta]|uniref:3-dehydrosphinganine reductase n=1 Tax=Capitella teleta TaxID=283909 RepID=R7UQH3_CAPTE|nr:hypothetical protein CAPTEDRAFT_162669 [Capitella teleta]|eukprot:ELU06177.1 hypothetical protein CAPTEDRAFT_162669 [Capitella teleta]
MWLWAIVGVITLFLIILYFLSPLIGPTPIKLENAHVLVTGGSSGIGKATAAESLKRGASVTLLARNQAKLSDAKQYLEKKFVKDPTKQKVQCISVDLSREYGAVEKAIRQAEENLGPVDVLVNSAGTSGCGSFEDLPVDEFKRLMDINYLGCVYATKALIKQMKQRQHGRIIFVSSQAGQLGLFGFSAYSASKFALRGLAEALQMELKPYNVYVTLAFPPDTDTPGFATELATKPKETKLISETAGLFQASYVAKKMMKDSIRGKFLSYMGMDGYMLSCITCGMAPVVSIMEATQQVLLMSVFRAISLFYLDSFDRIVKQCKKEREASVVEKKTD